MLYTLFFRARGRVEWKVPANTADQLDELIMWKLAQLKSDASESIQSVRVEVSVPFNWPTISYGSGSTWSLDIQKLDNHSGALQISFEQAAAFEDGLWQFRASLQLLTKVVAVHRKAESGKESLRAHHYDAANRMFTECQELCSGLLYEIHRVSP